MKIRLVTKKDFKKMLEIKMACIKLMHEQGNVQQYELNDTAYPNEKDWLQRISKHNLWAIIDNNKIQGFYFLETRDEVEFVKLGFSNTTTIHMIFIDPKSQRKGFASKMIKHAISESKNSNKDYLMIDTHEKNISLRSLAKKFNFIYIGDIYWNSPKNDVNKRLAFKLPLL